MDMVKGRKARIDKANYAEKINHESAPYAAVENIRDLEKKFFVDGMTGTNRQIFAALRNRYTFLHTCCGILRGESVFKAELSDWFGLRHKKASDAHPVFVAVLQIATGKTNKGLKLYGRVARHKEVNMCPIGALGFYLMYRFSTTNEFDGDRIPDFTSNEAWFDIKLLVESNTQDFKKSIKNTSYAQAVKAACDFHKIASNHCVHLGRVIGHKEGEMNGDDIEELRQLGNWDPKTQEKAYSNKLPMKVIRSRAGYQQADGLYFNPRTAIEPPEELKKLVFPWLDNARASFDAKVESEGLKRPTADAFLYFMEDLRTIILQDAAVIVELYPERASHPFFNMEVFNTELFHNFRATMRETLETTESPLDASFETVLPGVKNMLNNVQAQGAMNHQLSLIHI